MNRYLPTQLNPNDIVKTLGIISDTHMPERWRKLPTAVFRIFAGVDMILHAGDVGELWVLDELSQLAPVVAVHGNDESETAVRELPYQQIVTIAGQRILLWHNHYPDRIDEMAARKGDNLYDKLNRNIQRGRRANAKIVVFGHWHMPLTFESEGITAVNPGAIASGNFTGRQTVQTVALLYLLKNGRIHITHINLAAPDSIYTPPTEPALGFVANLKMYTGTILAPELKGVEKLFFPQLYPLAPNQLRDIWFTLAHECWIGKRDVITAELLAARIEENSDLSSAKRAEITNRLWAIVNGRVTKKDLSK